jgi:beta-glucanase (GH16 family)
VAIRIRASALALIALAITTSTAAARSGHNTRSHNVRRCLVPDVRGETLAGAKRRLQSAHCAAGRISGPRTSSRVGAQRPARGARERIGSKVALTMAVRKAAPTAPTAPTAPGAHPAVGPTTAQPVGIPGTWKLVLDSEFNGPALNTSIWRPGWTSTGVSKPANNNELDCYSPHNVYFPGDGTLHLDVTATPSTCGGVTRPYTGAMINTNPARGRGGYQYTYGVLEAKVYLPGSGSLLADWPGVWADGQNWPYDGEDDLMEGIYGMACWSFHNVAGMDHMCYRTVTPGWHTFASDWQPGSITYYYDGVDVGSDTSGITSSPMYIILDNTVHANSPVTGPDSMQVQYVRVWQGS